MKLTIEYNKIVAPISYQGGKQRIAEQISRLIPLEYNFDPSFHDLCCGSGAISIEMINSGKFPSDVFMLDASPWGLFWEKVGNGSFSLSKLNEYIKAVPSVDKIQGYVKELSLQPSDKDTEYVFLILQASSFGGKAIWIENNKWQNCSFRSYWQPTATSNRRSPVNPMMPMPSTLYDRVALICERMKGVNGYHIPIEQYKPQGGIVYIDPPYDNTTAYGYNFDLIKWVEECELPCFVSEGKSIPQADEHYQISVPRKKGGISGERKSAPNEEWISVFRKGMIGGIDENMPTLFG